MTSFNQPAIELAGVGKRFGRHWALAPMNLKIQRGESVALFGGNGSGKSTLLKIVATLLSPSTGRLQVLGLDGSRQKREIRRQIRLLAHEKQLYGTLTLEENLRLAAGLRGLPAGKIQTLLTRFSLEKLKDRKTAQLSEGMKKKAVLARLLLGSEESDLILLDEPHPTLDADGKKILDGLIQDWRREGKTVILASHDHERALIHADRVIVLEAGRIVRDGPENREGCR